MIARVGTARAPLARTWRALFAAFGLVVMPPAARAQAPIHVSVLTIGPGDAVFERFGHNALRVRDEAAGTDLAYNWGMFSFDQPDFLRRFLSGDTRYWVEAIPTRPLLDFYMKQDREIIEQDLTLTAAQAAGLAAFVRTNVLEPNKYYRYEYFRDNCSTRLRDALDSALAGDLKARFSAVSTDLTYRTEALRLMTPEALVQGGMDIALGPRADAPLSAWESMFIPMRLRDHLRTMTLAGANATTVPLVRAERVLYAATRAPEPAVYTSTRLAAFGPLIAVWMLMLAGFTATLRRRTRVLAAVFAFAWYTLTGLVGLILVGMWVGSAHVFWYANYALLLLSPLGLLVAWPVARATWRGAPTSALTTILVRCIYACAAVAILVALVGVQRIGGPLLLLLPAHLVLPLMVRSHTRPFGAARAQARTTT